ncbi:MAG: hypothetical protein PWR04_813 [Anaerophaga sp.]|nr:hypothetical protein [Anaerophaga sp.]
MELACKNLYMFFCGNLCHARFMYLKIEVVRYSGPSGQVVDDRRRHHTNIIMLRRATILLVLLFFSVSVRMEAQIWPFKKSSQEEKATRDPGTRKRGAGEGNLFNPFQPSGSSVSELRDDYIWSAKTAATSYHKAGNISVTTPSRYGLKEGLELSTWLGIDYRVPNLFLKNEISRGKLWVSSLHGVYSSWPGLNNASENNGNFLADSVSDVPFILSLKNQLIFSRPFFSSLHCNPHQPYLILSAALAFDYGISFDNDSVYLKEDQFKTPRSMSYLGEGWLITLGLMGDWQIQPYLYARGEIRMLGGNFPGEISVEQQSSVEYFPVSDFSVSGGYIIGIGNIDNKSLSILPFFDISFYFGKKQGRKRGLFEQQMF